MLENLNVQQKLAVETTDGPLLVLSGAGTGKTRVLTTRIAYILNNHLAYPWQVLALTFTNKAANEMKQRLTAFADSDDASWYAGDLWCGTFHSICLRILRANAVGAGLRRDFLIHGEDEQKAVLKSIFATMGLDAKDYQPGDWIERISSYKDKGLNAPTPSGIFEKILNSYNTELDRLGAVDFGDIILKVLQLFQANTDILAKYQNQFKYILVDEFQDTNNAQMQFLQMLTTGNDNPNICCVGDDDQSIYSWRGAEIKHILNFDKTYAGAQIVRLETNYRSTPNILGAANSLIRHNQGRLGKDLHSTPNTPNGEPVYVLTVPSDWDEARVVADAITRRDASEKYSDFAILIRTGSLSRLFEEEFATRGIPYRLVGTTKFYDRAEIRDAIAYLRILVYPFDDLSFLRVIAKPRRGFGPAAIAKLRTAGANLMDGLRHATLSGKLRDAANAFLSAFEFDWQSMSPRDAADTLLENSGYMKMWRESKDTDAPERIEHIRELTTNVISKYDTLPEFLEHAAMMMTDDNDTIDAEKSTDDAVSIMTIHAAKGLEFRNVFLPAWEDGIFPNDRTINEGALEEERRLAYVAITRARQRAIISNAMSRMIFGERKYNSPSRFITEMDNRFLDFQGGAPRAAARPAIQTSYGARPATPTRVRPANNSIVGKLCEHRELGRGVVIEENGDIATVAFRKCGIKKVAKQFLKIID
ncbi:MAG: UvrD-helicase domain-containing protein [Muribaculaceae bacterium]|nr:UvrD-helicase domain-containing protein [Muribaculaceae bacterium]